jgi:flavin-dependent dehydrogenase
MLCGDAANLIDPATGEGIGNAMLSGRLAAAQALRCLENDRYSADFIKQYDKEVYDVLWKELRNKKLVQQCIGHSPALLNQFIVAASKYDWLKRMVTKVF